MHLLLLFQLSTLDRWKPPSPAEAAAHLPALFLCSLFHDLLRLPILHHYVWSEITGHKTHSNASGKIVDFGFWILVTLVYYSTPDCGVTYTKFWLYCHCREGTIISLPLRTSMMGFILSIEYVTQCPLCN